MKRLRISDEARADLASVRAFTTEEWSRSQASAYVDAIKARLRRLRERPGVGVACDEAIPGLRRLMVGSHVIFYVEREHVIVVARILHQRMDYRSRLRGGDFG